MTENLAGRGEGLAVLLRAKVYSTDYEEVVPWKDILAALEAAAPPSTPDTSREALEAAEYALSHPESNQRFALVAVRAALATLSPQAPPIESFVDNMPVVTVTHGAPPGCTADAIARAGWPQEPAGSGASEQEDEPSDEMALELSRDNDEWTEVLTFPKRGFYRVRAVGAIPPLGTFCGAKGLGDYSCAECGFGLKEPCKHWKVTLPPSSPRKVSN